MPYSDRSDHERTVRLFCDLISREDEAINLPAAALAVARIHHPYLEIEPHLELLSRLGQSVAVRLDGIAESERLASLSAMVFGELGFRGNKEEYYDPCNNCLNDVLESRRGVPLTLSIVYMDIAEACGWAMEGVGFPGHFIVRDVTSAMLLDPFNMGTVLEREDLVALLERQGVDAGKWSDEFVATVTKRQMLLRLMTNLRRFYAEDGDAVKVATLEVMSEELLKVSEHGPASVVQ